MEIPYFFDSWASITLYFLLVFVLAMGIYQFVQLRTGKVEKVRSLVPIGGLAVCMGVIGHYMKAGQAFEAIQALNDINPGIVAGAMGEGPPYIILGVAVLGISFVFRYVNQK